MGATEMKGYVVIDTEVGEGAAFAEFVEKIPAAVAAHGGHFIVRGGELDAVEGDWEPQRLVIMEFESLERARGFIASADYTSLAELRSRAVNSRVVVVEGSNPAG